MITLRWLGLFGIAFTSIAYSQDQTPSFPLQIRDFNPFPNPVMLGIDQVINADGKEVKVIENQTELDCIKEQIREINRIAGLLGKRTERRSAFKSTD